jgi:hypothetical protein
MKAALLALACVVLAGCNDVRTPAGPSKPVANPTTRTADNGALDRDNTGVNVRDRDPVAKTPIDQNENKEDVRITADIRKRVTDTKMSVDAQNVKIITQDGRVTLRGPVKSDEERNAIEEIATDVAGAENVTNELEVSN